MKLLIRIAMFGQALMLAGCLATSTENQRTRIDEVPMYGGMDRSQVPELKAGDDKFIADVSRHYDSREKTSGAWVKDSSSTSRTILAWRCAALIKPGC